MGKFSVCEVCLMFWVVLLKHSDAEPLYFLQDYAETWDDARIACQRCFKDLATVVPNTTHSIAKNLSSNYWIGLRKHFSPLSNFTDYLDSNSSSSSAMPWSQWANGDPLAFQNWYPGWPKFKSTSPQISCCSCSCTCPAATAPAPTSAPQFNSTGQGLDNTSYFNVTDMYPANFNQPGFSFSPAPPIVSQCEKSPMLFPELPDPNRDYIEDSCVAILSNWAWVEKNCSDLLPFICYDDRFYGQASVSNVTSRSAVLTWLPVPGNVSRYHVKVTIYTNFTTPVVQEINITQQPVSFTYQLQSLLPGSRYNVTVVAVKCERDVDDPQKVSFYTIPSKVSNLSVVTQTQMSINLSWTKPDENVDFYLVQYNDIKVNTVTNGTVVANLTPGTQYNFTIKTGVNDTSKWSEPAEISAYTRPDIVSNLQAEGDSSSLRLNWTNPKGGFTGFKVLAIYTAQNEVKRYNSSQTQNISFIGGLPSGTEVNVTVTVLGNDGLEGDAAQLVGYTAPDPISNLTLNPAETFLIATWNYSAPVYSPFLLQLTSLEDSNKTSNTIYPSYNFTGLKTAVNYTLTVWSVVNNKQSSPLSCSIFTLPLSPRNAGVQSNGTNQLTFKWDPPENIGAGSYSVSLKSSFWGQTWSNTTNKINYTFSDLTSGSKYTFEVRTLAGNLSSKPATVSAMTVSIPVQINLAMLCSSAISLHCASETTHREISEQLEKMIRDKLGDNVFWMLRNQTSGNPST